TPYTSHLIVPDGVAPIVPAPGHSRPAVGFGGGGGPAALAPKQSGGRQMPVENFARAANAAPRELAKNRYILETKQLHDMDKAAGKDDRVTATRDKLNTY